MAKFRDDDVLALKDEIRALRAESGRTRQELAWLRGYVHGGLGVPPEALIHEGLADSEAGRVVAHETVVEDIVRRRAAWTARDAA